MVMLLLMMTMTWPTVMFANVVVEYPVSGIYVRAGVKYVLSNTNTNTKIWIFQIQIQIQIFCSALIQIQIQIHRFKYKYKYVQPNISSETVQIQNRAIL